MSTPKYLPTEKKVKYNVRLPKKLLDELNAYAELTNNTTTNIVISALYNSMKGKTVFNDYLDMNGLFIKIPLKNRDKENYIEDGVDLSENNNYTTQFDEFGETHLVKVKTDEFEIKKIPNNLDKFNDNIGYNYNTGYHRGIEFFIIPKAWDYKYKNNNVLNCLYCLDFYVSSDFETCNLEWIYIIDYLTAINLLNDANNVELKNKLINCISELKELQKKLETLPEKGEIAEANGFEELTRMAEKYNTGMIKPLGADNTKNKE